jgi:hypothetical protein
LFYLSAEEERTKERRVQNDARVVLTQGEFMYWSLSLTREDLDSSECVADGRFVLHRHRDALGPHFDLRLEQGGALVGWRIDGESLDGALWASEKPPHPLRWLDVDGDALREDGGSYAWLARDRDSVSLRLMGADGCWRVDATRQPGLRPAVVRSVTEALRSAECLESDAAQLVLDGIAARDRATARLCGLGRELDGGAFDESAWRKSLRGLSLDEIHAQLRAFEVRFDAKYPPAPVSRPERLPEDGEVNRLDVARAIAAGG